MNAQSNDLAQQGFAAMDREEYATGIALWRRAAGAEHIEFLGSYDPSAAHLVFHHFTRAASGWPPGEPADTAAATVVGLYNEHEGDRQRVTGEAPNYVSNGRFVNYYGQAILWYRRAAAGGNPCARQRLVELEKKLGTSQFREAEQEDLRMRGNMRANLQQAQQVLRGEAPQSEWPTSLFSDPSTRRPSAAILEQAASADVRGERSMAEDLYKRAIEAGSVDAYSLLGFHFHEDGESDEAVLWWTRGHEAGDSQSTLSLAAFHNERGELDQALSWWTKAADAGEIDAMMNLGNFHAGIEEFAQASKWYRMAIDLGSLDAMSTLAGLHHDRGDIDAAERLYLRAANQGNTEAMKELGVLLDKDRDDARQAQHWFKKAAESGDPEGFGLLGAHFNMRGDVEESVRWFRKASEGGVGWAMVALGNYHRSRREFSEARAWYTKAVANGDDDAPGLLKEIADEKDGGCYIATAVYGSYEAPEVLVLRQFRDERLSRSGPGRAFIRAYYAVGPGLVKHFGMDTTTTALARRGLDVIVRRLGPGLDT